MESENNVAAQAGDESMRVAFENCKQYRSKLMFKRGGSVFAEDVPPGDYVDPSAQAAWIFWQEAYAAGITEGRAYQRKVETKKASRRVSPRATADVGRNLRIELVNAGALRQYCHNDGSAGFVTAYDFDITNRFLAAISTTKPGA